MNYLLDVGGYKIRIDSDFSIKNKNDQIELVDGYVLKNMYDVDTFAQIAEDAAYAADSWQAGILDEPTGGGDVEETIQQRIYHCLKFGNSYSRNDWQESDLFGRPFTLELVVSSKAKSIVATVLTSFKYVIFVGLGDFIEPHGPAEISDIEDFCEDNNIHIPKMLYQLVT